MPERKTHEQFVDELAERNPSIEVLGQYTSAIVPILYRCRVCGRTWETTPNSVLRGHGCPACAAHNRALARRIPLEEFLARLESINPDVELVGSYTALTEKAEFRCRKCGRVWLAIPGDLLRGYGCKNCNRGGRRKTHDEFVAELAERYPSIEVLGQYEMSKTPILFRCKACGCTWEATPNNILSGHGCRKCAKQGTFSS